MIVPLGRVHKQLKANRFTLAWIVTIFLLIVLFALTRNAFAQEPLPSWWQNLKDHCNLDLQTYRGIEYCTGTVQTEKGETRTAHVIVVDLHEAGVRLEYAIAVGMDKNNEIGECKDVNRSTKTSVPLENRSGCDDPNDRDYYPVMTLEQAVDRYVDIGGAVVIDSDYSACTISFEACGFEQDGQPKYRDHGPQGLTVVKGIRLDGRLRGDLDNEAADQPWLAVSGPTPTPPTLARRNPPTAFR